MSDKGYRVRLEAFEGPLDLLLYLIRRAEVDITDIPVATIAGQYVSYLEGIERVDIDLAGEFLVMAATLMEIKSRMINPEPGGEEGEDPGARDDADREDPRAELVRQLLEYKKYRDAADELDQRREDWERRAPVAPAGADRELIRGHIAELDDLELEDVGLSDLLEAFQGIVASINFERVGAHEVVSDDTPIELHEADLLDRLRRDGEPDPDGRPTFRFRRVFEGRTRGEMIGLFLALLVLIRDQRVLVRQEQAGGEITISLGDEPDEPPVGADSELPAQTTPRG